MIGRCVYEVPKGLGIVWKTIEVTSNAANEDKIRSIYADN